MSSRSDSDFLHTVRLGESRRGDYPRPAMIQHVEYEITGDQLADTIHAVNEVIKETPIDVAEIAVRAVLRLIMVKSSHELATVAVGDLDLFPDDSDEGYEDPSVPELEVD